MLVRTEEGKEKKEPIIVVGPKYTIAQTQLLEMAKDMGFMLVTTDKMKAELFTSIAARMCSRKGEFVYQCSSFTLTNISLEFLRDLMPEEHKEIVCASCMKWQLLTAASVNNFLSPHLSEHAVGYTTAGSSRALKTANHPWIRVIATAYEMGITFYQCTGADKVMVNVSYALVDQHGEVHPPKDLHRREILLQPQTVTAIRQQAMRDVLSLYEMGEPLSAGFLRQLGKENEAQQIEALQSNSKESPSSSRAVRAFGSGKKLIPSKTINQSHMFIVESIEGAEIRGGLRGYWVRWKGYHPSWEAWRVEGWGVRGGPVITWEPGYELSNCEALHSYLQSQDQETDC